VTTTAPKVSAKAQAEKFAAACRADGFFWTTWDSIVTIQKTFPKGSATEYTAADSIAGYLLSLAPLRGGSVWGTTSDGVGGYAGLNGGYYRLNKSGAGARFLTELAKIKA